MATSNQYGIYVPTNYVWDIQQLQSVDIDPGLRELLIRLYQNINQISLALNVSDKGQYQLSEFVNGQQLFPNPNNNSSTAAFPAPRQIFRKVINFGPLPNAGSTSIAHNITCTPATVFTRIYATASDTTGFNYIPIPYASPTVANAVELSVNATTVTITTGSNRSAFNICLVVLEYVQN
jgi:hypothetical protein